MLDNTDDIGADIRAAIEGASSAAPLPTEGLEAAPPPIIAPETEAPPVDGRVRDATGKFARQEALAPTAELGQLAQATPVLAQEPPPETIPPPHSLKAAVKAAWDTYPTEIRQELVRIEQEAQRGKTEWQSKGERLNKFDAVIAPIRDRLTLSGIDEASYFAALSRADEMLRGPDKVSALGQLAQMYGIPLQGGRQPDPGQPQQQQAQPADPQFQALLQQHIQPLLQQVSGLQQTVQQQQHSAQQQEASRQLAETQALQGEVENFRSANLYFDNVKDQMAALLRSEMASDLKDAYEKACKIHPEVSQLIAAAVKPQVAPAPAPVALSVTGAPAIAQAANAPAYLNSDIEDDVRRAIMEVSGNV